MQELIASFTSHLSQALKIGSNCSFKLSKSPIKNIVICGMGGSGIGGTILKENVKDICSVPVIICKDYFIPSFIDKGTLFIASSYSGNTEETLHALDSAIEKKAQITCVTSGGGLLALAKQQSLNYIVIPSGKPPRAMFGFSFIQLFFILNQYGLINNSFIKEVKESIDNIKNNEQKIMDEAKVILKNLYGKIPVIYSSPLLAGVSVRFRQQLNENAKVLAWHHTIPEMNHNELVGWRNKNETLSVVFLNSSFDYKKNKKRMELNLKDISQYTSTIINVSAKGKTLLSETLYLIHLLDWVSLFLANKKNIDPVEVDVIVALKNNLEKN